MSVPQSDRLRRQISCYNEPTKEREHIQSDDIAIKLGSAPNGEPFLRAPCAAFAISESTCTKAGSLFCSRCQMVGIIKATQQYCSLQCQREDYPNHKLVCKDILRSDQWEPSWVAAQRNQASLLTAEDPNLESPLQFLEKEDLTIMPCPRLPAYDLLNLTENEGVIRDIAILLPCCGELHNLVETIVSLDKVETKPSSIFVLANGRDITSVIANLLQLLIVYSIDPEESELLIHLWYSRRLTETQWNFVHKTWISLLPDVRNMPDKTLIEHVFVFNEDRIRASLSKEHWKMVWDTAGNRVDGNDMRTLRKRLASFSGNLENHRLSVVKTDDRLGERDYYNRGMVLPFGVPDDHFIIANPLLYHPTSKKLLFSRCFPGNLPSRAWNGQHVDQFNEDKVANNDTFGRLFFFLKDKFSRFIEHMRSDCFDIEIQLVCMVPEDIPKFIDVSGHINPAIRFDRIETGNLCDDVSDGSLDFSAVFALFAPLLRPRNMNPKATLITFVILQHFMKKRRGWHEPLDAHSQSILSDRFEQLFQKKDTIRTVCQSIRYASAATTFGDYNLHLENMIREKRLEKCFALSHCTRLKPRPTILPDFLPYFVDKYDKDERVYEQVDYLLKMNMVGSECYLEFQRTRDPTKKEILFLRELVKWEITWARQDRTPMTLEARSALPNFNEGGTFTQEQIWTLLNFWEADIDDRLIDYGCPTEDVKQWRKHFHDRWFNWRAYAVMGIERRLNSIGSLLPLMVDTRYESVPRQTSVFAWYMRLKEINMSRYNLLAPMAAQVTIGRIAFFLQNAERVLRIMVARQSD